MKGGHVTLFSGVFALICVTSGMPSGQWYQLPTSLQDKRNPALNLVNKVTRNNPCNSDTPFPCKKSDQCIALTYVCDQSRDCADGYDEEDEVCTAFKRPPVEEIVQFLRSNEGWIREPLFGEKKIEDVARALAVSGNIRAFNNRLSPSSTELARLFRVLKAVENNNPEYLTKLGMPMSAWQEVQIFFHRILNSGFLSL